MEDTLDPCRRSTSASNGPSVCLPLHWRMLDTWAIALLRIYLGRRLESSSQTHWGARIEHGQQRGPDRPLRETREGAGIPDEAFSRFKASVLEGAPRVDEDTCPGNWPTSWRKGGEHAGPQDPNFTTDATRLRHGSRHGRLPSPPQRTEWT